MRWLVLVLIATAGFTAGAGQMSASTDCDDSLRERMMKDPNVEGECSATIVIDGQSVTKTYHASIETDKSSGTTKASLVVREFCESCKTAGAVERQAVDFKKLATWALAKAGQSFANGEAVSAEASSEDDDGDPVEVRVPRDSCSFKSDATDRISCRISRLNAEVDPKKMRAYYLESLQPDLQKLAASKQEADKQLFSRAISTMLTTASAVTGADLAIQESVFEFRALLKLRQLTVGNLPPQAREVLKTQYETIFRERPRYNAQNGISSPALDGNSKMLLGLVSQELSGAAGSSLAAGPRAQFGPSGLPPQRNFARPATGPGAVGGPTGLDRIFHRN